MSHSVILTREPVINKKRAITANRVIAHGPNISEVVTAFESLRDVWPVAQYPVFISLGRLVPTPDLLNWQIPENTMIEIPAQTLAHPLTRELMSELQADASSMCLAWYTPGQAVPSDVAWRFVIMDARKNMAPQNAPGLSLAWGVQDAAGFQEAIAAGYDGASGWFFLRDPVPEKELSPGPVQIIRLINLIRNNADMRDIEMVLKQDVALSYRLLRYINSAGLGLMCEIQSFRHAVSILGYSNLHKWLSLLLVNASRNPSAPAMMQTAIARGRFMEEVGLSYFPTSERDNLFITGAFSLLDVLLGASMHTVLAEMNLPDTVTDALLHSRGEFAPFLKLARLCEDFDAAALKQTAESIGLTPAQVSRAQLIALGFADNVQS